MIIGDIPGLRERLGKDGHYLIRKVAENQTVAWEYPESAEDIVQNYTVDQGRAYLKSKVDEIESAKFDQAFIAAYGFIPPAQQMIKWPDKEKEAKAWQAWKDAGTGQEPTTPLIDREVTDSQDLATRVAKVLAKSSALEGLRGAIEHNSVVLDDLLNAELTFSGISSVDLYSGWPV